MEIKEAYRKAIREQVKARIEGWRKAPWKFKIKHRYLDGIPALLTFAKCLFIEWHIRRGFCNPLYCEPAGIDEYVYRYWKPKQPEVGFFVSTLEFVKEFKISVGQGNGEEGIDRVYPGDIDVVSFAGFEFFIKGAYGSRTSWSKHYSATQGFTRIDKIGGIMYPWVVPITKRVNSQQLFKTIWYREWVYKRLKGWCWSPVWLVKWKKGGG